MHPETVNIKINLMREKFKDIIKVAFLAIFILHTCSITLFPHKHVIDGIVYVHSHPYQKGSNGNPTHTHDLAQAYTIQVLTHISVIPFIFFTFPQKITIYLRTINTRILNLLHFILSVGSLRLRAPPAIITHHS